jgi:hypothetical protein
MGSSYPVAGYLRHSASDAEAFEALESEGLRPGHRSTCRGSHSDTSGM